MKFVGRVIIAGCLAAAGPALAEQTFPGPDWKDAPDPMASPDAVVGGELRAHGSQYPKSLNYLLDNNAFSASVFGYMYESLLGSDPLTADHVPGLASKWTISDDRLTFTFSIDERAKWSDGNPVSAEDVRWTFSTIINPTNLTGVHKVRLEEFHPPELLSKRSIRFRARQVHWRNLGAIGNMPILPAHAYRDKDFNKINFEFPVVSGVARLGEIKEGVYIVVERRKDWWGWAMLSNQNTFNFETIKFRFYAERENAFEAFRKGLIDIYPIYTSRLWVKETKGETFEKNWIVKQKVKNYRPIGFQGFCMNMRKPPFDDLRVRKAMAHLLDREKINSTLMYSQYFMHKSYWEDLYDAEHECKNPLYPYDKEKARVLLQSAGWKPNPDTGILEKGGTIFRFKFLTRAASADKYLAVYTEDLKDVGIDMSIDRKDWATWIKSMDEFNFQMTWAAWGASLFKDPEGMWSSKEAMRRSGNNHAGFTNALVDAYIEQQRAIFDVQKRHDICRKVDAILTSECPYALLWNIDYVRLLYWNKFGTPPTVLSKYGDEGAAYLYWWIDEDSAADLEDAIAKGKHLPATWPEVAFDAEFRP